jgi:hypothetical protein
MPERVDRTHGVRVVAVDVDAVRGWPTREGIGDGDCAGSAGVDEILVRECRQSRAEVKAKTLGFQSEGRRRWYCAASEVVEDGVVEGQLAGTEPRRTSDSETRVGDLRCRERAFDGERAGHCPALVSACLNNASGGWPANPSSVR